MRVNGETLMMQEPCTLLQFLEKRNCVLDRVAVELNGDIVPKVLYESTTITNNDIIEIVSFIGGG